MCKRDIKMNIPPVIPLISLVEETSKDFPLSLATKKNGKITLIDDNMDLNPKKTVKKGRAYQSTS
jgi:hypothetical protein